MRKLARAIATVPCCLASYTHGRNTWRDVSDDDREQLHASLEQMQGRCCAYCEGSLDDLGQHIEHFRSRSRFVTLTFTWSNLYWSCSQTDSCGQFKDSGAGSYDPNNLLDPCVYDPSMFLRFHSDGTVRVRLGLSPRDDHRARETLRVFNLHENFGRLRNMRKQAASAYLSTVDELATWSEAERRSYAQQEILATASQPFSTVVRHMFEDVL